MGPVGEHGQPDCQSNAPGWALRFHYSNRLAGAGMRPVGCLLSADSPWPHNPLDILPVRRLDPYVHLFPPLIRFVPVPLPWHGDRRVHKGNVVLIATFQPVVQGSEAFRPMISSACTLRQSDRSGCDEGALASLVCPRQYMTLK